MHVLHVVGARPNFMKVAPVYRAIEERGHRQSIVHTGQHYDSVMSDVFFVELGIPAPTVNLEVGPGSHAQQTAAIMSRFESVVLESSPDLVLVYGDVNSTSAATLVCAKLGIRVGHVEAGLRSNDRSMPEEINRIVTDQLADLLFTPSQDGNENLAREGVPDTKIFFVGNVMIDTLLRSLPQAEEAFRKISRELGLGEFGLVTLHRPSNVDDEAAFVPILEVLKEFSRDLPLIFPAHPRTLQKWGARLENCGPRLKITSPLGYLDFLGLEKNATIVITDSGGVQEETTFLGVPCLTIRANTERPVTVTSGTNVLVGDDCQLLRNEFRKNLRGERKAARIPPLWDGHAARRIAEIICQEQPLTLE